MKRAIIGLLLVAVIGAGAGAYYIRRGGPEITVNTSPISRGDIIDTVGSTGTLQAVTTVQVGSQVSGNISWLGADFNSIVKKDQIIAKLEPSLFQAQLEQSKANVAQAQANLTKAKSDLDRMKVQLLDAQQKYTRAKELAARQLETQSDLDAAKIAVDSAQASLESQQATVAETAAAITQAQASLNQNQVNLDHTIIQAPIDGIVTQRSVDVGQTVAASMSAPTLFILAADLTKMQVSANIDESDVGRIRPGQRVTFRVDAYPTELFEGEVTQIRLNPVVVSNVTTYGTMIDVPNPELKLKPGMTANLKVEVARRNNVLRVPNAALRFRPTSDVFVALNQPVPPEALTGRGGRGGGRNAQGGGNGARTNAGTGGGNAPGASVTPRPTGNVQPPENGAASTSSGGNRQRDGDGQGGGRGGDPAQRMDRFKAMPPDRQQQFIARMKDRGQDTGAFEAAIAKPAVGTKPAASASQRALQQPKYGAAQSAQTIDALFAPVAAIERPGRLWLYVGKQLKPVNVRTGITDGTNTELITGDLQPNVEIVTSVLGVGTVRPQTGPGGGNPLLGNQPRGGGPGRGF